MERVVDDDHAWNNRTLRFRTQESALEQGWLVGDGATLVPLEQLACRFDRTLSLVSAAWLVDLLPERIQQQVRTETLGAQAMKYPVPMARVTRRTAR